MWPRIREPRRRCQAGAHHRAGDRHGGETPVPGALQAGDVRPAVFGPVDADPAARARPSGASGARAPGGAGIDRPPEERPWPAAAPQRSPDARRHRAQRRSMAHAARQLQWAPGGSGDTAARHSRSSWEGDARALRPRGGPGRRLPRAGRRFVQYACDERRRARARRRLFQQSSDGGRARVHRGRHDARRELARRRAACGPEPRRLRGTLDGQLPAASERDLLARLDRHHAVPAVPR